MAHHRHLPSIEPGRPRPWTGDADLRLFDCTTEELARLTIEEPIAAYYRQVGVTWNGGRILA
ncbi:acetoacetate decarboxylase family protein [Actinomadura sp. NTSP31]|uniref:acetoacetate decarboxylase family protein n=1 Tax=Actinomadura sp. NTSP31 TaxID=1735447 RepID=UPI0035BFBBFF